MHKLCVPKPLLEFSLLLSLLLPSQEFCGGFVSRLLIGYACMWTLFHYERIKWEEKMRLSWKEKETGIRRKG
jgi:hypothetical protein